MGSGSSSSYSGGGSQPYAPTYHVASDMFKKDKQDPNIYNPSKGYFKNPLATTIQNAIVNDKVVMNGVSANGQYTYVMDTKGNIIFAKRFNPNNSHSRAPHPTLIGGKEPVVQCAGMICFKNGRISWYDNDSGHFRPNAKSLDKVDNALNTLRKQHPKIFDKNYSAGKKYE